MSNSTTTKPTVYPMRWGVLVVYSLVALVLQLQWLMFAPVAREAAAAYGVEAFDIDLLSLVFMLVFVVTCIPASYVLDRFGLRTGVGAGAALMGAFGLVKGFGGASYAVVLVGQIGVALSQPLVINAVTKLAAQWFPMHERATAVGIATLSQFIGIIVVMLVTPGLAQGQGAAGVASVLSLYGWISAGAAVLFLVIFRERPPTAPGAEKAEERLVTLAGFKHLLRQRSMRLLLAIYFVGLGVFNALSTCIDQLCAKSGLSADETGMVGGIMFIAGIVGAAVWPPISDRTRRRKPFLLLAMAVTTPALLGLTIADGYLVLLVASGVLGFFLLGAGAPVGFQYAAEVSYPTAESTSQGLIMWVGQISGIALIVAVNAVGIGPLMWVFVGLAAIAVALAALLPESPRAAGAG